MFFFKIHLRRWYRYLNELGPVRAILILIVSVAILRYSVVQFIAGVNYWGYLPLLIIQTIQFGRRDFKMLKMTHLSHYKLYFVIYSLMALPGFIAFANKGLFVELLISVAFTALIPLVNFKKVNMDPFFVSIGDFLPYQNFEWRTGLRQYGLAVIVLTLAGTGLSFFPGGVPIVIFFLTLNTSVFYLFGESKELLVANYNNPKELLNSKLKAHFAVFFMLILPMSILYLVFNIELWYILLYVWIIAFVASINAILFKYKSYEPGARFDNNNVLQGLMLMFFLIPFLFPIPVIMMVVNYKKSIEKLKPFFSYDN